jgi:pimeloyl-ACP methyl ester carboxylesterase
LETYCLVSHVHIVCTYFAELYSGGFAIDLYHLLSFGMFISANGVRLFVEVFGAKLEASGPTMKERPTVVALHGGPADHVHMRSWVEPLSDVAQVVLFDQRGCGRSESGPIETCNMAQWGDDVKALCDTLGIEKPIVLGGSFGGFVAQSYASRHPDHPSKVGLFVTGARQNTDMSAEGFRKQGGDKAATAVRRMYDEPSVETVLAFFAECGQYYSTSRVVDAEADARTTYNIDVVTHWFNKVVFSFDFRRDLSRITAPVLLLGGDEDPILPPIFQDEIEQGLTSTTVERVSFPNAGHHIQIDAHEAYFHTVRSWITN